MKSKIPIPLAIGVLVVGFGLWYYLASKAYNDYSQSSRGLLNEIAKSQSTFLEAGKVRSEARYEDVGDFIERYTKDRPSLLATENDLRNGKGMAFWLPNDREQLASTIGIEVSQKDTIFAFAKEALQAVSDSHESVRHECSSSSAERSNAEAVLNPKSDIEDFILQAERMNGVTAALGASYTRLQQEARNKTLGGSSETLRLAMLSHLGQLVAQEEDLVANRAEALGAARAALIGHKASMTQRLSMQSPLVASTNSVARKFSPMVGLVDQKIEPIRSMIGQLEEPLFSTGFAGGLSSLVGGGQSEQVSAMSLVRSVDPSTGAMIDAIKNICEGIASAREEISRILNATEPFLNGCQSYRSAPSRENMLNILGSAPNLASYFESKRNAFDPVTRYLDEGRNAVYRLNSVAARVRIPAAQNLIYRVAGGADQLLSAAYSPFMSWRQTVSTTSASVNDLQEGEKEYLVALESLKAYRDVSSKASASARQSLMAASDKATSGEVPLESAEETTTRRIPRPPVQPITANPARESKTGNISNNTLAIGLVAHYPFDGNADDASGNRHNGILNGGVSWTSDRHGNPRAAVCFNGTDAYIDYGNLHLSNLNCSISMWFRTGAHSQGDYSGLIGDAGMYQGFTIHQSWDSIRFAYQRSVSPSWAEPAWGIPESAVGRWKHLAVIYANGQVSMYIDGELISSVSGGSGSKASYLTLKMGADAQIPSKCWNGALDEVRLYDKTLTPREVQALYSAQ